MNAELSTIELHGRIASLVDAVREDRDMVKAIRESIDELARRRRITKSAFGLRAVPWRIYFGERIKA